MWSSILARTRVRRASAASVDVRRSGANLTGPVEVDHPAGQPHAEALQCRQVDVAVVLTADELQCSFGTGPGGVETSSIVTAKVPVWSSHHQMSMPR